MATAPIGVQAAVPPEAIEFATSDESRQIPPSSDPERARKLIYLTDKLVREGLEASWDDRKNRALNREYYRGNTRAGWDPVSKRVTSTTRRVDGKKEVVEYVTLNITQPAVDIYTSSFAGATPVVDVDAGSTDTSIVEQSHACDAWIDGEWDRLRMGDLYYETAKAALLDGVTFWKVWFDPHAGRLLDTMIVMDETSGEVNVIPVHEGFPRVELVLADNLITDPSVVCPYDGTYMIELSDMSTRRVRSMFNKEVKADRGADATLRPYRSDRDETEGNVQVRSLYIRPGVYPASKDGRDTVVIPEGWVVISTKDTLLYEGPWRDSKYPFPFIEIKCLVKPGERGGETPVKILRVAQVLLDKTLTNWDASNQSVAVGRWLKPVECDIPDADWNNIPGSILRYAASSGYKPELVPGQGLPYSVTQMVQFLVNEYIPHIMGQHSGGMAGGNPGGVESGYHYAQIAQHDFARQNPMARELKAAIERWGDMMLELASQNIPEERLVAAVGKSMAHQMIVFSGASVHPQFRVRVQPESITPQTKEQRLNRTAMLLQMGILPPHEAARRIGEEPGEQPTLMNMHVELARNENFQIMHFGVVQMPEELMARRDAGFHQIHAEQVKKLLADPSFDPAREPQKYAAAIQHLDYHERSMAEEQQRQMMQQLQMQAMQMQMQPPAGTGSATGPPPAPRA